MAHQPDWRRQRNLSLSLDTEQLLVDLVDAEGRRDGDIVADALAAYLEARGLSPAQVKARADAALKPTDCAQCHHHNRDHAAQDDDMGWHAVARRCWVEGCDCPEWIPGDDFTRRTAA